MSKIEKGDIVKSLRKSSPNASVQEDFKNQLLNKVINTRKSKTGLFNFLFHSSYTKYISFGMVLTLSLGSVFLLTRGKSVSTNTADEKKRDDLIALINGDIESKNGYTERTFEDKKSGNIFLREEEKSMRLDPPMTDTLNISEDRVNTYPERNLKGGEIDDNLAFDNYIAYLQNAKRGSGYNLDISERYFIKVTNETGKGILGKEIIVTDDTGYTYKLRTDADGGVYFYPGIYGVFPNSATMNIVRSVNKYTVEIDNNIYNFTRADKTWSIRLNNSQSNNSELTLDLAFVIDTTGSMSDQINKLKQTVDSISVRVNQMQTKPKIRFGMVLYRDKTDQYLTRVYDFTTDLEKFRQNLNTVVAGGGGDYPEDVNTALADTLEQLSWSNSENSVKVSFLIADAPPHMDYGQSYDYKLAVTRATEMGVKIFPLASSGLDNTEGEYIFRQIALITNAKYLFITNAKGGTDYHIGEQEYTVDKLDDLIVKLIGEEVNAVNN